MVSQLELTTECSTALGVVARKVERTYSRARGGGFANLLSHEATYAKLALAVVLMLPYSSLLGFERLREDCIAQVDPSVVLIF